MALVSHGFVRHAADALLDEGLSPVIIIRVLTDLTNSTSPLGLSLVATIVNEQTAAWLNQAEDRMRKLAAEGSWTRLGQTLALYQKVTGK